MVDSLISGGVTCPNDAAPADAAAQQLFKAMDGIGTTERVISEILVTSTNAELAAIKVPIQ